MRHMGEPKTKLKPSEAYAELRRLERAVSLARQSHMRPGDRWDTAAEATRAFDDYMSVVGERREFERKLLDGDFD